MSDKNNIRQELYDLLREYKYSIIHLIENSIDIDEDTYAHVEHDYDCNCECDTSVGLHQYMTHSSSEIADSIMRLIYNDVLDAEKLDRLIEIGKLAENVRDGVVSEAPQQKKAYVEFDETMKALM